CKVLPNLRAEFWSPDAPRLPDDLVLGLSPSATLPDLAKDDLYRDGRSPTLALFAALQIVESRQFRKLFNEYVVFDTETTDRDVDVCEVVELAAARVRGGEVVDRFHSLVRCGRPISGRATDVHGYKDADLVNERTFVEIWPDFRRFIGDAVLI